MTVTCLLCKERFKAASLPDAVKVEERHRAERGHAGFKESAA
jgi:hypothetical protein